MKKLSRREERELALKYLYSLEIQQKLSEDIIFEELDKLNELPETSSEISEKGYHMEIVIGCFKNLAFIDNKIKNNLVEWRLERLSIIDKNILRIAIYEIIFNPEVPKAVAIDEAVEIAKKYGSQKSSKFINGILGQIEESENPEEL